MKKILTLTVLSLALITASVLYFKHAPPPASQVASLAYTDDNTDETLIIKTDRSHYAGFTGSGVQVSIENTTSDDQNVTMQFHFPPGFGSLKNTDILKPFFLKGGETRYFNAEIAFKPGEQGEFWIEATGDKGAYGLLDPWFGSAWSYRRKITIDHNKVSGGSDLTNFPMVIQFTAPDLKASSSGGFMGKSNGTDIVFTSSDQITSLSYEFESYSSQSGSFIAWVKIPTLKAGSDTILYMYYGNYQSKDQQNRTSVWDSNYRGVWHLPNGTTLTANDSTSAGNAGTITGATATTGVIDGSATMDGTSSSNISAAKDASITYADPVTVSFWARNNTLEVLKGVINVQGATGSANQIVTGYFSSGNNGFFVSRKASSGLSAKPATAITQTNWNYFTITNAGGDSALTLFVNGVQNSAAGGSFLTEFGNNVVEVGKGIDATFHANAAVDELRVSNVVRSNGWIATEYNNQVDPTAMAAFGGAEVITRVAPSVKVSGGVKVRGSAGGTTSATPALISSVSAGSAAGNTITTGSIDTTGANFLVLTMGYLAGTAPTISDSKGNTWSALTASSNTSSATRIFYVANPTVGTGHTFTATVTGGYPAIAAMAFSGVKTSSPFDAENGAGSSGGTSIATGSITPSENGELLVTGLGTIGTSGGEAIDNSFTIQESVTFVGGQHSGLFVAWKVQSTAAAINPTWSWTTFGNITTRIASFKAGTSTNPSAPGVKIR